MMMMGFRFKKKTSVYITTEAMGFVGLRERSLSHSDKVNAGAKTARSTSAAQMPIGVC